MNAVDEIQSHVLGIIVGLMNSYHINVKHVSSQFDYVNNLHPSQITQFYEQDASSENDTEIENQSEEDMYVESMYVESGSNSNVELDKPLYVSTRRQFCSAMQKGIRICPRYASCSDTRCKNFHVHSDNICPHVVKGNYCDQDACDMIVIRACRKGKNCHDSDCSFRHQ